MFFGILCRMTSICTVCDCSNIVYPSTYFLQEDQRTEDKKITISHPEIRTTTGGHRFVSQADRISILRKNICQCKG